MLSTIRSSNSMSGYSLATSRLTSRKRPSEYLRMFALWTDVTFLRPCLRAYSKAYLTIRRVPVIEIGLIEIPESGRIVLPLSRLMSAISSAVSGLPFSNSQPRYRSSVFSRTMTRSTLVPEKNVRTPAYSLQGRTQA